MGRNIKVLLVTGSFPPMRCGVGDYTFRLALTLARMPGLQVAVLTSKAATPREWPKEFCLFSIVEKWDWRDLGTIVDLVRAWAPDIVHIQLPTLGYGNKPFPWFLPLCLYLYRLPVVQTWHAIYRLNDLFRAGHVLRFISKALVPGGLVVVKSDYRKRTGRMIRWALLNKEVRLIPNASAISTTEPSAAEKVAIRAKYARSDAQIIVFFGFIYPSKRVELLFQIADPNRSHLVIIGDGLSEAELAPLPKPTRAVWAAYNESLKRLVESEVWNGKATLTGFLPADEAARVIASADAVVLPMLGGAGDWNTSVHAAQAQGTFVLTTSRQRRGYDSDENTYFAGENDIEEMKRALQEHAGKRSNAKISASRKWSAIAEAHVELYRRQVSARIRTKRAIGNL